MTTNSNSEFDYPVGWGSDDMPRNEGDVIRGTVTELSRGQGNYDPYVILVVTLSEPCGNQKKGTRVAVHCFHTALANKVHELRPTPGEKIAILYRGQMETKTSRGGRPTLYHSYVVKMEDRTQAGFWDEPETMITAPVPASDIPNDMPVNPAPDLDDDVPF